jgi:hypothetical protein
MPTPLNRQKPVPAVPPIFTPGAACYQHLAVVKAFEVQRRAWKDESPSLRPRKKTELARQLMDIAIVISVTNRYKDIKPLYPILRLAEAGPNTLVGAVSENVTGVFGHRFPFLVMTEGKW